MPASLVALALLAAAMAGLFVVALAGAGPTGRARWALVGVALAAAYLGLSGAPAASGALADLDARPPPAVLLIGGLGVATVALAASRVGDRLLGLPLGVLVGFQAFRVPVEGVLAWLYADGVVPVEVTYHGLNLDIVAGALGGALGLWLWRGSPPRWAVALWNAVGVALLATVVVVATRSALGVMGTEPRMTLPTTFPGVWLPAWLVQLALLGHLLVFRALRQTPPADDGAARAGG